MCDACNLQAYVFVTHLHNVVMPCSITSTNMLWRSQHHWEVGHGHTNFFFEAQRLKQVCRSWERGTCSGPVGRSYKCCCS